MARRGNFDPLEQTQEPRWYVVRNMHGALLEARELPPGADLKRVFVEAILKWMEAGWKLKEFHSVTGVFFCDCGAERRMVEITPTRPGRVQSGGIPQHGTSQVARTELRFLIPALKPAHHHVVTLFGTTPLRLPL